MCYIDRSIEQVTSTCAMCKVFPPRRDYPCLHKDNMGVCKNRVNHPKHDVVFYRNAELSSFNGCGYCKWAKSNPKILASPESAWRNPGWPGCCRPPKPTEYKYINAADWYAITKIHGVIAPSSPTRTSKSVLMPAVTSNSTERRSSNPPISSRRSSESPQAASTSTAAATAVMSTMTSSSPQNSAATTTTTATRPPIVTRETTIITLSPKSPTKPTSSSATPSSSSSSSSSSPPSSSPSSVTAPIERRVLTKTFSIAETPFATLRGPPPNFNTSMSNPPPTHSRPPMPKLSTSVSSFSSSSSSSSSRSPSSGSVTQSETVTSEGFTDYLSDESEAEMQREAERRAHEAEVVARLQRTKIELGREEEEFRAARNQLASVGLQPPPAWSSGKLVNTPATKEQLSPPPPPASLASGPAPVTTSRPSKPASMYSNTPMVQVYTAVRQ